MSDYSEINKKKFVWTNVLTSSNTCHAIDVYKAKHQLRDVILNRAMFGNIVPSQVTIAPSQEHMHPELWTFTGFLKWKECNTKSHTRHGPSIYLQSRHGPEESGFNESSDQAPVLVMPPKPELATYGDSRFYIAAPVVWNPLPRNIRQAKTPESTLNYNN